MDLCPQSLWEDLSREDSTCTFYQTSRWHQLAARHYRAESVPLLFRFGNTSACLPLLKKRRWARPDHYFSPFGTYSALICPRKLEPEELAVVADALKSLNLYLASSPFTSNPLRAGKPRLSKTQVVDTASLDPENPMSAWDPDPRRRAGIAQRNNVKVRQAESKADWDRYYALYQHSLSRWGKGATGAYPRALFEDIRGTLAEGSSSLWLAEHEGETGAGYLVFYHNRRAFSWHGAAEDRFFKLGMTQALHLAMFQDAHRRGFSLFDLGGSSGLSRLETFKAGFGARTLEFQSYLNRPGLWGLLAETRDAYIGRS